MDCPFDSEQLDSYIDGELDPIARAKLESHLGKCADCRQRQLFASGLKASVRESFSQEPVPAGLRSRLMQALSEARTVEGPALEHLGAYLDGELPEAERKQMEQDLASPGDLRRRVEFLRGFKALLLNAVSQEKTPELLRRRILKALGKTTVGSGASKRRTGLRRPWYRPALAAASVLVVSFLAFMVAFVTPTEASPLITAMGKDHQRCCGYGAHGPKGADACKIAETRFGARPELIELPDRLAYFDLRMCAFPDDSYPGSTLHLLYQDQLRDQLKVSLFGLPDAGRGIPERSGKTVQPQLAQTEGLSVAAWKRGGWVYSLVAELPPKDLAELVESSHYALERQFRTLAMQNHSPCQRIQFLPNRELVAGY